MITKKILMQQHPTYPKTFAIIVPLEQQFKYSFGNNSDKLRHGHFVLCLQEL